MTKDERIAALREALEVLIRDDVLEFQHLDMSRSAIAADDLAAAEPLPDLPLAEGSRWDTAPDGSDAVRDRHGLLVWVQSVSDSVYYVVSSRDSATSDIRSDSPNLIDVLALARRAGVV